MTKKECYKCKEIIDLNKELYVTLGIHKGKEITDMQYFHFNCWRSYFEEQTRKKAKVIVDSMQERMMPIAKQLSEKIKGMIGNGGIKESYKID
jgi:hypothetical protein